MRTVLLDTNVLLADPNALTAFPEARVIIPETVLVELDKLKTARVDPDLRFRGREVSRMLFELSEGGRLVEGVGLPDGGELRVVPLESETDLPDGLSARNSDDRILGVGLQVCKEGCEDLTIVTNDLNMLLKAQTLGLKVERYAGGVEGGFARRYIIRPFQRYKVPLTILAIALAVFAGVVFLSISTNQPPAGAGVPAEFRDQLSSQQRALLDSLVELQSRPDDPDAILAAANAYYDLQVITQDPRYASLAIQRYQQYLKLRPDDVNARADMAPMLFARGQTDSAIEESTRVLRTDPELVQAHFNLGIFYWRGRRDYRAAAAQFIKVIDLTKSGDQAAQAIRKEAADNLGRIEQEAKAAGERLPSNLTSAAAGGT